MSERKVQNVWIPPDFDPSKSKKTHKKAVVGGRRQTKVRLMAPFTMQCMSCANWIPKSTKFNARKETVPDEDYLGLKIFRFYIRCTRCGAEITFKTDPKNADYVCENNAVRHFEPQKRVIADPDDPVDVQDAMQLLEERTKESKREMDILDALDEIRTRNALMERLDTKQVLEKLSSKKKSFDDMSMEEQEAALLEADAEYARQVFGRKVEEGVIQIWDDESDTESIKRIDEEDEDEAKASLVERLKEKLGGYSLAKRSSDEQLSGIVKKKKSEVLVKPKSSAPSVKPAPSAKTAQSGLELLGAYSDSD
jgi:hypothetical protein